MINENPFSNNRAEYMKELWRYYVPNTQIDFGSLRPIVVEGGRGTGKTTLFLCNCWREKYAQDKNNGGNGIGICITESIIGIYYKVDPVFVSTMNGNGEDESFWNGIFNTYISIEVLKELFSFIKRAEQCGKITTVNIKEIIQAFYTAMNCEINYEKADINSVLNMCERILDGIEDIMNGDKSGEEIVRRTAPGTIVKRVVEQLRLCKGFENVAVKIYIDEFESMSEEQQKLINTLIKRSNHMLVYNIGVKTKGIKTIETIAEREVLQETHDYTYYCLDKIIAENYTTMLKSICQKRLHLFKEQMGIEISEDIVTYLGMYSFEEELERFNKKGKASFYSQLEELIKLETDKKDILNELCMDAPPIYARMHLALLLRNDKYRPKVAYLYLCYKAFKSGANDEYARKYKDWEHNTKNAILFLLAKDYKMRKWYYGFDCFVALSSGTVRFFLELCEQTFNIAIQNNYSWIEQKKITPEIQTRAANYVSRNKIMEIESYANCGKKLMIFTLALGKLFQELHRNNNLTLGEPEPNHFSIERLSINENVKNGLNDAIRCSILIEMPETKEKDTIHTNSVDYHLNRIFAPYFEISYFKKRKLKLTNEIVDSLMSESQTDAEKTVRDYLKNYWKNKKCVEEADGYSQLSLFS